MPAKDNQSITCPHCKATLALTTLRRNCSNCFSCTGCERYTCPQCDKEIVVQEVKQAYSRKTK